MKNEMTSKNKIIWIVALVLFVCVCCTTYVWVERMNRYPMENADEIVLTPDHLEEDLIVEIQDDVKDEEAAVEELTEEQKSQKAVLKYKETIYKIPTNPSIEVSDSTGGWESETAVELFRVSYENGATEITVQSDDGSRLIAPGTSNSYTFKLRNTGDVGLNYIVDIEAYVTPGNIQIPVVTRLSRYDSKWLVGSQSEFEPLEKLNGTTDRKDLSKDCYVYYTLEWQWPFESGNDEYDTLLGNTAVDEDIVLTIKINTSATPTEDYFIQSGILAPNTGDDMELGLWILLSVSSLFMLLVLIYFKKKSDEEFGQKKK